MSAVARRIDQDGPAPRPYALGYSEGEFRRLELQSAYLRDLTEDVLKRAGIGPGMRVLDLGCGVGDVSLLAGEIVGPSGLVVGVDRSPETIKIADRRAIQAGQCFWVRFTAADLDTFVPDEQFDAIIGRLILMYLPNPAATIRRLSSHLRPGGVVAFQEISMPLARSVPDGPLFGQSKDWLVETFERIGVETDMGSKLFATFVTAGLPAPQMIAAGRVEGGPEAFAYRYMAETLRSLLPAMERAGVASATELDVDTLADRLRSEAMANRACIMLPPLTGAWTRLQE